MSSYRFLVIVVMIAGASGHNEDVSCPPNELLAPCYCNSVTNYPPYCNDPKSTECQTSIITCYNANDNNDNNNNDDDESSLKVVFDQVSKNNRKRSYLTYDWFYLIDTQLTELEGSLFENIHFANIYLKECPSLLFINESAFGRRSDSFVRNMYINASQLSDETRLKRSTFKALSSLEHLDLLEIQASDFRSIPVKAFNRENNIRIIRFYNPDQRQKLETIHSRAFYKANKVTEIDLKYNRLRYIHSHAFQFQKRSDHEVKIFLSGNELHADSFGPAAFNGGRGRKVTIYLGDYNNCNQGLTVLKQEVFESFLAENDQNVIDLYGCPIVCDHRMDWMFDNFAKYKKQVRNVVCLSMGSPNDNVQYEINY